MANELNGKEHDLFQEITDLYPTGQNVPKDDITEMGNYTPIALFGLVEKGHLTHDDTKEFYSTTTETNLQGAFRGLDGGYTRGVEA